MKMENLYLIIHQVEKMMKLSQPKIMEKYILFLTVICIQTKNL